ncbi:hypothetical protein GCM10018793_16430 [Streptomyces sulfonofaciens]|uniref:Uncharacterized protein n=1 Tax=Streptomyces sulfonofaciens TaxID=68272 RepID=A0A919FZ80_9ACTN|nr:hypothetical protein [Streptomyces sulfonofaciens]GHH74669.1 hypothetical protein GCM10018793_16430 [Streptomyces sulfonofaciens]
MTQDEDTETIIQWILSYPVLAQHLREIAADGMLGSNEDPDQELVCTVADLLRPSRSPLWADVLRATGVPAARADALWYGLGGEASGRIYAVQWPLVRLALSGRRALLG